ncbi:MAG: class I SAM-dependent methyltransferase [Methylococcaceae bacterium]
MNNEKQEVHDFWNQASCGEALYLPCNDKAGYLAQAQARYELEGRMIFDLAHFEEAKGMKVLEVGVGLGADHQQFAEAGADLYGIDLTERAIEHTRRRFAAFGLLSNLAVGDAENLDFPDNTFDQVYSWGVLHHSPNTAQAVAEVWRVLKPGGVASIMIYHKYSLVGLMLWVRYALLGLRPWLKLSDIYAHHMESPGTKAYSVAEARQLFSAFKEVQTQTLLSHGDLLESNAGQRHRGGLLTLARKIWPRWLIRRLFPYAGIFMLIEARK